MGEIRKKYDEDFKKNAVKLSYASPKSVREIAEDLGIHENLLYNWRGSILLAATRQSTQRWRKRTETFEDNLQKRNGA